MRKPKYRPKGIDSLLFVKFIVIVHQKFRLIVKPQYSFFILRRMLSG